MNNAKLRKIKKIPAPYAGMNHDLKYFRSIPGILLIFHGILSIFVHILWSGTDNPFFAQLKSGAQGYVLSVLLMQGLCVLLPSVVIIFAMKIPVDTVLGKPSFFAGNLIMAATAGVPAAVVFIGLNNGFIYLMSRADISLPKGNFTSDIAFTGSYGLILSILLAVLLPGIIEELMFRGVIFGSMHKQGGGFSAIFFSALAFSLFHADPVFVLAPFLAGLLLGFLRYKSDSIYPPIAAHISMNLTILLARPYLPKLSTEYFASVYSNTELYASLLAAALASTALVPMLIVFSSSVSKQKPKRDFSSIFPFDYKYIIGILILISTLLFVYFSSIV